MIQKKYGAENILIMKMQKNEWMWKHVRTPCRAPQTVRMRMCFMFGMKHHVTCSSPPEWTQRSPVIKYCAQEARSTETTRFRFIIFITSCTVCALLIIWVYSGLFLATVHVIKGSVHEQQLTFSCSLCRWDVLKLCSHTMGQKAADRRHGYRHVWVGRYDHMTWIFVF